MTRPSNYSSPEAEQAALAAHAEAIAAWPVSCEERLLPTTLGETFVLAYGDPALPPLVLLHGSASNLTTWAGDAAAFAAAFRVYAVDLPGESGRSTGFRPPYEGATYPDWLAEVMDGLGVERASLAGVSLGGWVALKFAARHPSRVERIALISPGGLAPAKLSFALKAAAMAPLGAWGRRRTVAMVFAPLPAPPAMAKLLAVSSGGYRARRDRLPILTDDELRAVRAPVLYLAGRDDRLLDTPASARRLRRFVPHAQVRVLPGVGHVVIGAGVECIAFLRGQGGQGGEVAAPTTANHA